MRISQLAKNAEIGVETVRYYQRIGLMGTPNRPSASFRSYEQSDLDRLRFIRRAQALGFSLDDIAGLLRLSEEDCAGVQRLARDKLVLVRQKMAQLIRMEHALKDMISQCSHRSVEAGCPIIAALSDQAGQPGRSRFICELNAGQTSPARQPSIRVDFSTSPPASLRTAKGAKVSGAVRKPTPNHLGKESI